MKELVVALCAILAVTTARVVINIEGQDTPHLLGAKACTWGPSYWCQNLTTAAGCHAIKQCIPKVWEKLVVPEDRDSVCQICKDMVKQARDQLESNQTQQDLKAVFEGSCALIYIKPIVKECDKLVDEFIPELVETLASQMEPSVVCSVAGLCNSAHIDKLIEEYQKQPQLQSAEPVVSLKNDEYSPDECSKCYTISQYMEQKFEQTSRDKVLEHFLTACGEFSSFSDACASIILTHFETIYSHLQSNLKAQNICHLSGQCSGKFHVHEDEKTPAVEIRPLSSVGMVEVNVDLPCKLCEQLVTHLRELLVANTTETEFQQVLEGLCKQTKSFATECKAIVDQYYPEIYSYLTKGLNSEVVCQMGGLCPAPGEKALPIWPLVSDEHAKTALKISNEKYDDIEMLDASKMQLPIERMSMTLGSFSLIDDTYCSSCEFVLSYVKKNVRNLKDRGEVTLVLREVKGFLPGVKGQPYGENFLTKYEEALIELIVQVTDLSEICSQVAVCPTDHQIQAWQQIPFTEKSSIQDKPSCPLCLFAVTKLYDFVKDDKTEAEIEAALDKLCNEMPKSLQGQCVDLVKIYSKELVQLIISNMTPQEVCTSLKLCDPQGAKTKSTLSLSEKIVAVPKNDVQGKQTCALCEYVLHYLQQVITDPKAENEVKFIIDKVCKKLPKSIENECNQFVDTYGDALVSILAQEFDPSQVCPMIHLCPSTQLLEVWGQIPKEHVIEIKVEEKPNCPLCLFGVTQLYNAIKDNKTEAAIEAAMEKLCSHLPKSLVDQCETLVQNYSKQIIEMILADLTPQEVCVYLQLCDSEKNIEPQISFFPLDKDGEIMTNEIPEYPTYIVNTENTEQVNDDMECTICTFIMQYVEKSMGSKKSKDEIEHIFHGVCNHLPRHMSEKCNTFVTEYADIVIELLTQEVSPKQICAIVDMCKPDTTEIRESVTECALCQDIVNNIEKLLVDPKVGENIEEVITRVCKYIPEKNQGKCTMLMEIYEQSIIDIVQAHGDTRKICTKLSLCSSNDFSVNLLTNGRTRRQADDKNFGTKQCTWGISYWCLDVKTAEGCKALELCKKKGFLGLDSSSTTAAATLDEAEVISKSEEAVSQDAQASSSS